jgi:diguanylate cyclase (GGDEF)-like protein/PAS domain S-box-containing protein
VRDGSGSGSGSASLLVRASGGAGRQRTSERVIGRLASIGLVVVLAAVPGFALWAAIMSLQVGIAAMHAGDIADAFVAARYAIAMEESLERKYRLEPSFAVRARHHAAGASLVASLEWARSLGASGTFLDNTLAAHVLYLTAIDRMFAAIDAHDSALATKIDGSEVDPTFDSIQQRILAQADISQGGEARRFAQVANIQDRVLIATPIVFGLGACLVLFFWRVLRSYRHQADEAILREAIAANRREQRFRALVQNTNDVILICAASGEITYQSPAAETDWGYAADELLTQSILALAHPDSQPALRELWEQVQQEVGGGAAGTSRSIEPQMRDRAGNWRVAQLILTNLLRQPAVAGVVATIRDIRERKAFEHQITHQAFYDSLTGLANRPMLQERLRAALVRAVRRGSKVGVALIDIDNFRLINDSLGRQLGDDLLMQAVARLQSCVRGEDTLARIGGDEFVIVLEHLMSEADALPVAAEIANQFNRTFAIGDHELTVTVSTGIAMSDAGPEQAETLMQNAGIAMFRAKGCGKARFVLFDTSMQVDTLARLELEEDLRHAITHRELRVYYQPVVAMASGHITEMEALIRWQHPVRGLVQPKDFIDIAEETGLIVPLGQWVLEEACRQVAAWHDGFPTAPPLILSVNLSPKQLQLPNLIDEVTRTLRITGLPPSCLKLEITEGVVMRDVETTIITLWKLKELGIRIAVDDFGTGYSSLAYLKRLPLDILKIDRSFVSALGQNHEDTAIVKAMIAMAKSLKLAVTAEGVETREQAMLLSAWGCNQGQGYYYGKPLDSAATAELLRTPTTGCATRSREQHNFDLNVVRPAASHARECL